nr:hypothetical protein BgiMline_021570 [Biomphalaria glabrata]
MSYHPSNHLNKSKYMVTHTTKVVESGAIRTLKTEHRIFLVEYLSEGITTKRRQHHVDDTERHLTLKAKRKESAWLDVSSSSPTTGGA